VKVMARCATHIPVGSPWSSETLVTITVPINRVSPADGESYALCSLYQPGSIPAFAWNPLEPFHKLRKFNFLQIKVLSQLPQE